jgi:transposase
MSRGHSTPKLTQPRKKCFKKTLPDALHAVRDTHPDAQLEQWTMDEHRIGLKPIIRRVWRRKGRRPVVRVHHRYKWMYLYGFVCPSSGDTFWLVLPTVSVRAYTLALKECADAVGAGADKRVILVLDQAGWHISGQVVIPEGLHLVFLPPYSPELQPAEHLWELTDQAIANRHFQDLDELTEVQAERCRKLQEQPELIRNRTHFHWWPELPHNPSD